MIWSLIPLLSLAKEVDFSYCADGYLSISSMVMTPDHFVIGQDASIVVSGTGSRGYSRVIMDLSVVITPFTNYAIVSDYDICGGFVGGCPVESGDWTWEVSGEVPEIGSLSWLVGLTFTVQAIFREENSTVSLVCIQFPLTIYDSLQSIPTSIPTIAPTNKLETSSSSSNQLTKMLIPMAAGLVAICLCCGGLMYRDHRRRQQWMTHSCQRQNEEFTASNDDKLTEGFHEI